MRRSFTTLSLLYLLSTPFAHSADKCNAKCLEALRREVEGLIKEVRPLAEPLLIPNVDAQAWLSGGVPAFAFREFNKLSDPSRKAVFRSSQTRGNYAKDSRDCLGGTIGYSINPRGHTGHSLEMQIGRFEYKWERNAGLRIWVRLDGSFYTNVHYHLDEFCIGGGRGWDGWAKGSTSIDASALIGFDIVSNGDYALALTDIEPSAYLVVARFSAYLVSWPIIQPTKKLLEKPLAISLSPIWQEEGEIVIGKKEEDAITYPYSLQLDATDNRITNEGYEATFNLKVKFQDPPS